MNKKVIEAFMERLWNRQELEAIDELFHPEAVIHSPLGQFRTAAHMKETVRQWLEAIPDISVELQQTLVDQDIVTAHWTAKGTHQKELNRLPAKGNPVNYRGVTLYRFEKGKVVEYWAYLDSWTLAHQIQA